MKTLSAITLLLLLQGCASRQIDLSQSDTIGAYQIVEPTFPVQISASGFIKDDIFYLKRLENCTLSGDVPKGKAKEGYFARKYRRAYVLQCGKVKQFYKLKG